MQLLDVAVVAALVVAYAGVSQRLEHTPVTAPMLFVAAGLALGPGGAGLIDLGLDNTVVRGLAELTLVLVLFSDAARIDLRVLRRQYELPARLLGIGLPGVIATGAVAAAWLLPDVGLWEAALLATVLAPTDPALAQAVVTNPRVPLRIRQAVNVESGLNDGIVLPIITVLVVAAGGQLAGAAGSGLRIVAEQLGYGAAVGLAGGYFGGKLIDRTFTRGWMSPHLQQLAALAVGVGSATLAGWTGGSAFIAAFTAGITFGLGARDRCQGIYDFTDQEGHLLTMLTFLVFGGALLEPALRHTTVATVAYAAVSLTLVRILPVAASLVGTHLRADTVVYLGWFGPRGLASIVFGLVLVEESGVPAAEPLLHVVVWTVLLSVVAHGASASPAARWYAHRAERWRRQRGEGPEHAPATQMPTRR